MTPNQAQKKLDKIYSLGYTPRSKEAKVLRSITSYIDRDGQLTPPLAEWLDDLYEKAIGGGRC